LDFNKYIEEKNKRVNEAMDGWLPNEAVEPSVLHRAMRYSLFAGGKRLRPVLGIAAAECVGGDMEKALPAACAVELIHTYSLIHDDLPVMDNDDYRRGKLSNHKVFGDANAILAGDALLTYAFELVTRESLQCGLSPETVNALVLEIATASGTAGMVGGQVMDLASEGKQVEFAILEELHRRKTGALLRAAVRVGALSAGADPQQLARLSVYAESLGLAFQIKDDILDVEGDSEKLGKAVGSDVSNQKSTYPAIIGLEQSKILLEEQVDRALQLAKSFGERGRILAELAKFIRDRDF